MAPESHSPSGLNNKAEQARDLNRRKWLGLVAPAGVAAAVGALVSRAEAEDESVPRTGGVIRSCEWGIGAGEDATATIQSALDAVTDGSTVIFTAAAAGEMVYRLSATLVLKNRRNIALRAEAGARLEVTTAEASVFQAEGCENLCLSGLDCFGSFPEASTNHRNDKLIVARDCRGIRVENCRVQGLVLAFLENCDGCVLAGNSADSGIDAGKYSAGTTELMDARANGFNYGIQLRNCSQARITGNVVKNCCLDGIKIMGIPRPKAEGQRFDAFTFAAETLITENFISGCVNADGVDVYNSGDRVIIANNILQDNQKAFNIKQENNPQAPVLDIIVANNLIRGGRYNSLRNLQFGIVADTINVIIQGNLIRDIEGVGILVEQSSARVLISNCIVENVRISPHLANNSGTGNGISDVIDAAKPKKARPDYGEGMMEFRDGEVVLANCIVRQCERNGIKFQSASRGVIQSCVVEDAKENGIVIDGRTPNKTTISIQNCRVTTRGETATKRGFYFTSKVVGPGLVSGCVTFGNVEKPLVDETKGRLVDDRGNSWNRTEGPTGDRPDQGLRIGAMYFDTDLGRPVWWNGSAWRNSEGQQA
jgi:hypothetical protein